MDLLAIQIESPRHIAWAVKAAALDPSPMNAAMMKLYATHRLLRILCGCGRPCAGGGMGRIEEMVQSLLDASEQEAGRPSSGLPPAVWNALRSQPVRDALKDMATTATSLIIPDTVASRTPREWQVVSDGLTGILGALLPLAAAFRMAAGDGLGGLNVAVGPEGSAFVRSPGNQAAGTSILFPDGSTCDEYGPAYRRDAGGTIPEPLIPWISEVHEWETFDGLAVKGDGTCAAPVGPVNGSRALGRLLAWSRTESWELAERLARIGAGETAVEYILVRTAGSDEWRSPPSLQKLIDFVGEHGSMTPQFIEFAHRSGGLSESAAMDASDWTAAAGILVVRQQLESGADRARTLRKLANLYLDRLDDRTAAQMCMVKALEATPDDSTLLAALLDITGEIAEGGDDHGLAGVAASIAGVAKGLEGRPEEADVLRNAVGLYSRTGDVSTGDKLRTRLLELDPNAVELFEEMHPRLGGPAEVLELATSLMRRAWKSESRGRYLLATAAALRKLGRLEEAASALKEASSFLPDTVELLDAMRDTLAEAGDWSALMGLLKRRAELLEDPEQVKAAALEMADIALDRMNSPVVALASLTRVAHMADQRILRRMFAIHAELGMWIEAARDLEGICASTGLPGDLVDLARIYRDRLGRPAEAATKFKAAMTLLEGRELAAAAIEFAELPGVAEDEAAGFLNRAAETTDDDLLKATILKRLGGGTSPGAHATSGASTVHLEEALRLNPADHECAIRLAEIYLAGDMAEKAAAALEPPARAAGKAGDRELETRLRLMAAGAAARCFDHAGAARHLNRILEISPGNLEALRRLARTEVTLGQIDQAMARLDAITSAGGALTPADAGILRDLGRAQAAQGNHTRALRSLENAWHLDSDLSEDVLRELSDMAGLAGDRAAMVSWLKRLVNNEEKSPRRFSDLIRLGDTARADGDAQAAIDWYLTAADEEYSKKLALHKALEVSLEAGRMQGAVELLERIIGEEQDSLKKSDFHLALALIFRDNLRDDNASVDHLRKALALNPENEPAAQALDTRLLETGMFDELAESLNLRARHFRMTGNEHLLLETLRTLGDVYENRLHNAPKAVEVFEQIIAVAPHDPTTLRHLAFCQARIPGAEAEALLTLRKVIVADPTSVDSYRALRDLAILSSNEDLATRASTALMVLGHGDESDFNLAARNRSAALHLKADQIPGEVFTRRIAFDLDARVARIFELLYQPILRTMPFRKPADLGLSDRNRIDMDQDGLFQKMADAVGHVFGMKLPDFWYAAGTTGMKKAPFAAKAVVVGDDLVQTRRGKDLRYSLSRAVVSFMPGAELCGVLDAPSMRLFFLAALKMAFPEYVLPPDAARAAEFAPGLARNLKEPETSEIRRILSAFGKTQRPADFPAYMRAVDRIAGRAGLFMANDLEVAAARSLEGDMALSDMEPGDKVVELCSWAVSADYTELRNLMIG